MLLTPPNNGSVVSLTPVNSFSAVSLTPAKNVKIFGYFPWQGLIASVVDPTEQFIAGVNDTGDKYSFANISANFWKNSKRPHWNTWGPGEHWFMKKTWSRKSRVRLPLKAICHEITEFGSLNSQSLLYTEYPAPKFSKNKNIQTFYHKRNKLANLLQYVCCKFGCQYPKALKKFAL